MAGLPYEPHGPVNGGTLNQHRGNLPVRNYMVDSCVTIPHWLNLRHGLGRGLGLGFLSGLNRGPPEPRHGAPVIRTASGQAVRAALGPPAVLAALGLFLLIHVAKMRAEIRPLWGNVGILRSR